MRGEPQHFVASKVMCWVAADRGVRLAEPRGDTTRRAMDGSRRQRMHAEICKKGVDARGDLHPALRAPTRSTRRLLLIPIMGFLPPDDDRVRATVLAIADELTKDGLVLRYQVEATDDGLSGEEGTFTICSFWLVSALAMVGETDRARALFEKLLSFAGPLLLYAEEIDDDGGRHLGNYPQAFTHLALIDAANRLIAADRRLTQSRCRRAASGRGRRRRLRRAARAVSGTSARSRSRCSIGGTTISSNHCCTRWPPASSPPGQIAPALRHVLPQGRT